MLGHRHHFGLLGAILQMQQDAALLLDSCVPTGDSGSHVQSLHSCCNASHALAMYV